MHGPKGVQTTIDGNLLHDLSFLWLVIADSSRECVMALHHTSDMPASIIILSASNEILREYPALRSQRLGLQPSTSSRREPHSESGRNSTGLHSSTEVKQVPIRHASHPLRLCQQLLIDIESRSHFVIPRPV